MTERLFDIEIFPEVPVFREPRRAGAARGVALDARFQNDYPPEWDECLKCDGLGFRRPPGSMVVIHTGRNKPEWARSHITLAGGVEIPLLEFRKHHSCDACRGMGSVKARVRLEAGHRCIRCLHPYVPKGDAEMFGEEPSWRDGCEGWTPCDDLCDHAGPVRWRYPPDEWAMLTAPDPEQIKIRSESTLEVEASWRILTVHHADGDKANLAWWNLLALCQVCHLEIQAKVVMERVYPWEHSSWFKPYVAAYYAHVYLGEAVSREETCGRLEELLALERAA